MFAVNYLFPGVIKCAVSVHLGILTDVKNNVDMVILLIILINRPVVAMLQTDFPPLHSAKKWKFGYFMSMCAFFMAFYNHWSQKTLLLCVYSKRNKPQLRYPTLNGKCCLDNRPGFTRSGKY